MAVAALALYFAGAQQRLKYALGLRARFVPLVERALLCALYLAYLPWCLSVSRHLLCVEMHVTAAWQRRWTCASLDAAQGLCAAKQRCGMQGGGGPDAATGGVWGVLAWTCAALFAAGLPALFSALVRRGTPFAGRRRHEQWLQSIEAEYMLHLSSLWSHQHYALIASFRRPWAHYYTASLVLKAGLAAALAASWDTELILFGTLPGLSPTCARQCLQALRGALRRQSWVQACATGATLCEI